MLLFIPQEARLSSFLAPLATLGPDKATCGVMLSLPRRMVSVITNDRFSSVFMSKGSLEDAILAHGTLPHVLWAK